MVSILASGPNHSGFVTKHSRKNFRGKFVNVAEVNNGSAKRQKDSNLKMLIEPI